MTKQLNRYFLSGVKQFFSGTLLSRISGLGRDLAMAYSFGDHPAVAAFMVAFRFSHLLRRFLGEGPLQFAFISHFEGLRAKNPLEGSLFFRHLILLLTLFVLTLIFLMEGGIGVCLHFFDFSQGNRDILQIMLLLIPSLFFVTLYGMNVSFLQCHNHFFIPSVAPLFCNVTWICGALYLKNQFPKVAMIDLAKWVVIGCFFQWLITVPLTWKNVLGTVKEWRKWKIHPEIGRFVQSISLGGLGVGATQVNACLDAMFARSADLKAPIYLWYSIRFQQLALALFGIAAIHTLMPLLSRRIKEGNIEKGKEIFEFGVRRILTVMLSCTLAAFTLGYVAMNLVYGRGHFSPYAVDQTTHCFWAYSLGLVPATLTMFYSSIFYAKGDFKTPAFIGIGVVALNALLNSIFIFGMDLGAVSTALATSLGSWANYLFLRHITSKQGWFSRYALSDLIPLLTSGVIAGLFAYGVFVVVCQTLIFSSKTLTQFFQFLLPALGFISALFVSARLFKNKELLLIFQAFSSELNRTK